MKLCSATHRWLGSALLLALAVTAGGCSGTGSLSGTVTSKSKNKKLMSGTVAVFGRDNVPRYGDIKADGTYTVSGVPSGPVKMTVSSPHPRGVAFQPREGGLRKPAAPEGGAPAQPEVPAEVIKGWFGIADKYGDVNQSGLTTTVNGATTFNIVLD